MTLHILSEYKDINYIYQNTPVFPGKIYYHPKYLEAAASAELHAIPLLLWWKAPANEINPLWPRVEVSAIYAVLVKSVPITLTKDFSRKIYIDMETPYGYGGPIFFMNGGYIDYGDSDIENEFFEAFYSEFNEWAKKTDFVAEFIRFNPLTNNQKLIPDHYDISLNRKTVCIDTSKSFDEILSSATSARRRNYKKARNLGLTVKWYSLQHNLALETFKTLYEQTMTRLNADAYYHFSSKYYNLLAEIDSTPQKSLIFKPDSGNIAIAYYEGMAIASVIFLQDYLSIHYHLSCADDAYKDLQPTAFIIFEALRQASEIGYPRLHLGGGLSLAPDDQLFNYKKGFAPNSIKDFYIGKRIIKPRIYSKISQNWQRITGKKPTILLHYHNI